MSETMELIDETLDVVEKTIDQIERHRNLVAPVGIAAGVAGLLVGAAIGYKVAQKRLEPKYAQLAEQEIAEAKRFYSQLNKKDEFETPESAVRTIHGPVEFREIIVEPAGDDNSFRDAAKAIRDYSGESTKAAEAQAVAEVYAEEVVTQHNVFLSEDENWNQDFENSRRNEDYPYIISTDEYMGNETGYEQTTITYYEGDDTLVDERDEIIPDVEGTVMAVNLVRFGHGSGDYNVLYIRNHRMQTEFEVIRHKGKYVEQVLGFIEHSDSRRLRRFRGDDE